MTDEDYQDSTPVFRSSSLQFSLPTEQQTLTSDRTPTESAIHTTTFAEMARRYNQRDDEFEVNRSTPEGAPVTGVVRLQPTRKKLDGLWRPARILGSHANEGFLHSDIEMPSTLSSLRVPQIQTVSPAQFTSSSRSAYIVDEQLNNSFDQTMIHGGSEVSVVTRAQEVSSALRGGTDDIRERLFGILPDPIKLHEKPGEFDGQVVFIGHPNRDITAHQWSTKSFQWVSIGRYANSRGRIEGSLSVDRLNGVDTLQSPLEFFQLAAKNRERIVRRQGRTDMGSEILFPKLPADLSSKRSLPIDISSLGQTPAEPTQARSSHDQPVQHEHSATPGSAHTMVRREYLEDPFVAPPRSGGFTLAASFAPSTGVPDNKGSLDFGYEFPSKASSPAVPKTQNKFDVASRFRLQSETHEHGRAHTANSQEHEYPVNLRDVAFGEEAASRAMSSTIFAPSRVSTVPSLDHQRNRMTVEKLDHVKDHPSARADAADLGRTFAQATSRSMRPPPGFTVANPHRPVSTLNARAPPYPSSRAGPSRLDKVESDTVTTNTRAGALRFSDPDGMKSTQDYEIVNGLAQQPPTKQDFKGPFFKESKPTAHDPTTALAVPRSKVEELQLWFHNELRASRQEEYAQTLITSAVQNNKGNKFGAIGDRVGVLSRKPYENTSSFIRLYDNFAEYAEESRGERTRSYFTRAFKTPILQLRDLSETGNNSFFSEARSKEPKEPSRLHRMYDEAGYRW